jgi:hypothetical protein
MFAGVQKISLDGSTQQPERTGVAVGLPIVAVGRGVQVEVGLGVAVKVGVKVGVRVMV